MAWQSIERAAGTRKCSARWVRAQTGFAMLLALMLVGCHHRIHLELGARVDRERNVALHVGAIWMPGDVIGPVHVGLGLGGEYDSSVDPAVAMGVGAIARHNRLTYGAMLAGATSRLSTLSIGGGGILYKGSTTCSRPLMFEMHLRDTCKQGLGSLGGQLGVVSDGRLQVSLTADLFELRAD